MRVLAGFLSLLLIPAVGGTQCPVGSTDTSEIHQSFEQKDWAGVVRLASPMTPRSGDEDFEVGIALARMQEWPQARAALMEGERVCPLQKRFDIELAGIALERKLYPEAAMWVRRGLKLDEKDEYANNFAGTVYLLMGNMNAALKYWNRIGKPYVNAVEFDPQLRVQRLILDRAFAFSPAAVLAKRDFESTEARVNGLGIFARHKLTLETLQDGKFDAQFEAAERDGFGSSRAEGLASTFGGAAYETIYPSYFNIGGSAMNFESLLRFDAQKRRAWVVLSAPLHGRPEQRWQLQADGRNENWAIRDSFTGTTPVLGSLNLEREALTASITSFSSGRVQWSTGAELSHRSYRNVVAGTALTPALVVPAFELKYLLSAEDRVIEIPEHRFTVTAGGGLELARAWSTQAQVPGAPNLFARVQESTRLSWFPQAEGDNYEFEQRLRAGQTAGNAPFDELFLLGMERDSDLWARGQIGTRDGRKGSSPLGSSYFLSNTDLLKRVFSNGLLTLKAGPLLDVAKTGAPMGGLAQGGWIYDVGAEARFTVLGASVVLTYGRDLRSGSNAFFGTAAP